MAALALAVVAVSFALRVYRLPELPPGLFGDEGWNLADIVEMRETGRFPLFFPNNTGREPLFIYLQAAMTAIAGITPFAARLTSAFVGTVTVALLYRLARALFGPGSWAPLVSAAVLAFTLYHLLLSRVGLRAISLAPFATASLLFLWDAYRFGRWRSFLLGGLFLGLTQQTYLAARVVPLVPMVVLAVALLRRWPLPAGFWLKGLAAGAVAMVVAAPLLLLIFQDPFAFQGRAAAAKVGGLEEQLANLGAVAGMFTLQGSEDLRHNLPLRPVYDPAFGLLFLLGVAAGLGAAIGPVRRRLSLPQDWELPAILALSWLGVMLIPILLSREAPHFLRSLGAAPAAALFSGFGAEALRRRLPTAQRPLLALLLSGLLVFGSFATVRDYFDRWARLPDLPHAFDAHMVALADYLRIEVQDHPVSLDAPLWWNGTLRYAFALNGLPLPRFLDLEHVFAGRDEAAIFQPGMEYILLRKASQQGQRMPPWLQDGHLLPLPHAGDGMLSFRLPASLRQVPGLDFQTASPVDVSFAGVLALSQAARPLHALVPGEPFSVVLRWRVLQPPQTDYHLSLRALDAQGHPWAVLDERLGAPTFPSSDWLMDEVVYTAHSLTLVADAPPGRYTLAVTVYDPEPQPRTLSLDSPKGPQGELLEIGKISVPAPSALAFRAMRPDAQLDQRWPGLTLFGYTLTPTEAQAGEAIDAHLFWSVEGTTEAVAIRLDLVDADGAALTIVEEAPLADAYPFASWRPGDALHVIHRLPVPSRAAPGASWLIASLVGPVGATLGSPVALPGPEIRSRPRRFDAPPGLKPVGAQITDLALLVGYAAPDPPQRGPWPVSLAWRAVGESDRSYAVTVQLLDQNGRLVAQHDGPPAEGGAPTSSWLSGEVVLDSHVLSLPTLGPGRYTLIAALYGPQTGQRLPVGDSDHVVLGSYELP